MNYLKSHGLGLDFDLCSPYLTNYLPVCNTQKGQNNNKAKMNETSYELPQVFKNYSV